MPDAEHQHAFNIGPEGFGRGALFRLARHPIHFSFVARVEPSEKTLLANGIILGGRDADERGRAVPRSARQRHP